MKAVGVNTSAPTNLPLKTKQNTNIADSPKLGAELGKILLLCRYITMCINTLYQLTVSEVRDA